MRALSYVVALVLVLTSPSLPGFSSGWAGSGDGAIPGNGAIPGIGTFAYNGSPIVSSALPVAAPQRMASLGH